MHDMPPPSRMPSPPLSFDGPLGRKIIELHVWAVGEGLRGTEAAPLFDGLCQRLVTAGLPLWRAFAGMKTLHPQWGGYGYTWWRHLNAIRPQQFERGDEYEQGVLNSPIGSLIRLGEERAAANPVGDADPWLHLRRRLTGPEAQLDFPSLAEYAAAGATDYFAEVVRFGADGDPSRGTGVGYSFATDRPEGFHDDDLVLLKAVLPVVSLAMMTHAGHTIASGLLAAYLGDDAGRRVHAGAVERGSVESMLAIFPFDDATREQVCRQALDAAAEAMRAIDGLNAARREAGKPAVAVDLALHLGEVLYGNVGAVDRLDFTVIGPAVNEAARIELLCEPLGRKVLVSAELAATVGESRRLVLLGCHKLRGVGEMREVYGLELG